VEQTRGGRNCHVTSQQVETHHWVEFPVTKVNLAYHVAIFIALSIFCCVLLSRIQDSFLIRPEARGPEIGVVRLAVTKQDETRTIRI
jgi:hypothetical protein